MPAVDSQRVKIVNGPSSTRDVRDLRDGTSVDQVMLVREREIRRTRTGADYMRLTLADRTGVVPAVVWDDVEEAAEIATSGEPVRVIGTFAQHPRYGGQITVMRVVVPLEVDWERLLEASAGLANGSFAACGKSVLRISRAPMFGVALRCSEGLP